MRNDRSQFPHATHSSSLSSAYRVQHRGERASCTGLVLGFTISDLYDLAWPLLFLNYFHIWNWSLLEIRALTKYPHIARGGATGILVTVTEDCLIRHLSLCTSLRPRFSSLAHFPNPCFEVVTCSNVLPLSTFHPQLCGLDSLLCPTSSP